MSARNIKSRLRETAFDRLYVWRASEVIFYDSCLYKIGLTRGSRYQERICETAESAGLRAELILHASIDPEYARDIERLALSMGIKGEIGRCSGSSEFRWLTAPEVRKLEKAIRKHPGVRRVYKPGTIFNDYVDEANHLTSEASSKVLSIPPLSRGILVCGVVSFFVALLLLDTFGGGIMFLVVLGLMLCLVYNLMERRALKRESLYLEQKALDLVRHHRERAQELCQHGRTVKQHYFRVRSTVWATINDVEGEK